MKNTDVHTQTNLSHKCITQWDFFPFNFFYLELTKWQICFNTTVLYGMNNMDCKKDAIKKGKNNFRWKRATATTKYEIILCGHKLTEEIQRKYQKELNRRKVGMVYEVKTHTYIKNSNAWKKYSVAWRLIEWEWSVMIVCMKIAVERSIINVNGISFLTFLLLH